MHVCLFVILWLAAKALKSKSLFNSVVVQFIEGISMDCGVGLGFKFVSHLIKISVLYTLYIYISSKAEELFHERN